eukprot:COSAG01_NODE_9065_length_2565_cov_1.956204_2_plen_228_part_00
MGPHSARAAVPSCCVRAHRACGAACCDGDGDADDGDDDGGGGTRSALLSRSSEPSSTCTPRLTIKIDYHDPPHDPPSLLARHTLACPGGKQREQPPHTTHHTDAGHQLARCYELRRRYAYARRWPPPAEAPARPTPHHPQCSTARQISRQAGLDPGRARSSTAPLPRPAHPAAAAPRARRRRRRPAAPAPGRGCPARRPAPRPRRARSRRAARPPAIFHDHQNRSSG